jgi:hypothetical protein
MAPSGRCGTGSQGEHGAAEAAAVVVGWSGQGHGISCTVISSVVGSFTTASTPGSAMRWAGRHDPQEGSRNTRFSTVSIKNGDESAKLLPSGSRTSNLIHTRPVFWASSAVHSLPAWSAARQLSPVA